MGGHIPYKAHGGQDGHLQRVPRRVFGCGTVRDSAIILVPQRRMFLGPTQ